MDSKSLQPGWRQGAGREQDADSLLGWNIMRGLSASGRRRERSLDSDISHILTVLKT